MQGCPASTFRRSCYQAHVATPTQCWHTPSPRGRQSSLLWRHLLSSRCRASSIEVSLRRTPSTRVPLFQLHLFVSSDTATPPELTRCRRNCPDGAPPLFQQPARSNLSRAWTQHPRDVPCPPTLHHSSPSLFPPSLPGPNSHTRMQLPFAEQGCPKDCPLDLEFHGPCAANGRRQRRAGSRNPTVTPICEPATIGRPVTRPKRDASVLI